MLKWTVSRSLSTASSTPHTGVAAAHQTMNNKSTASSRKPFRDLSNTPPTGGSRSRINVQPATQNSSGRPTPGRRRRCRSHGSDLRAYFQATKPNLRSAKRQSVSNESQKSPRIESFYQSTPRVDADIGPLTLFAGSGASRCSIARTLPSDPTVLMMSNQHPKTFYSATNNELPQNVVNEARANLQSHVSDFFHQISVAGSPEDVMEAESVPLKKSRIFVQNCEAARMKLSSEYARTPCHPKVAKVTKLHTRCKTPYHTKIGPQGRSPFKNTKNESLQQTPLAGRLAHLRIDQDLPNYENMDNTVTEVINREQEANSSVKTVAEILILDAEERRRVLHESDPRIESMDTAVESASGSRTSSSEHIYETIAEREDEGFVEEGKAPHNDSSVSSASQLLEDPSPMSWAFRSPSDSEGVFTLRRQRGIRRKRQKRDQGNDKESTSKKRRSLSLSPSSKRKILETQAPPIEAINHHVKKCALETDLDSTFGEVTASKTISFSRSTEEQKEDTTKTNSWELDSPKSSLIDDFQSSKSFLYSVTNTPEAPLVATVRRCLKYSPESEPPTFSNSRGSIEIECNVVADSLHVRVIRCKELRRTYEGPIHAYVKASVKNPCGEGAVVKRTAVHRATPNPVFHETLVLPYPALGNNNSTRKATSLDIAVWHRDRRARRSELLGCMTLPLPLAQDKEATWHPLEAGSGRNTSTPYSGLPQECAISPPLSKDGGEPADNNNSNSADDLTYLRYLELEPLDPLTGLPLHPTFTARGGRTPCTITRRLIRQSGVNQVPWGFSLSWGRPPRVERVDTGSPAERAGLRPGDHVVFVDTTNVVTLAREDILSLIQSATNQLILEVYRKGAAHSATHRPSVVNVTLQPALDHQNGQLQPPAVAFTAEVGTGVLV